MTLERTYELAPNPPPPLTWEEYENCVQSEWQALLAADPPPDERTVQAFLEQHPCLVPLAFGPGLPSGHHPYYSALVSQPVLPDYPHRRPDFMWIAQDSMNIRPVLIEIEAPRRRWFRKDGKPTAHLNDAIEQLREWRAWLGDPVNALKFRSYYGIHLDALSHQTFRPTYALVYGRRDEATAESESARLRNGMQHSDEHFMSYDRLSPNPKAEQLWTVREKRGHWQAVCVPPTTKLGPAFAEERSRIRGREEAIRASAPLSQERADFLIDRLPYWDAWASSEGARTRNAADWE